MSEKLRDDEQYAVTGAWETFCLTPRLRWVNKTVKIHAFYNPNESVTLVLQQAWQGSAGTIRWEDVPVEEPSQ